MKLLDTLIISAPFILRSTKSHGTAMLIIIIIIDRVGLYFVLVSNGRACEPHDENAVLYFERHSRQFLKKLMGRA